MTQLLQDERAEESPFPEYIQDGLCTKKGITPDSDCHLGSCLQCIFNPDRQKNYIKFVIPYRYKECHKKNYPMDACKNCSGESDCKLLDKNKELWQ